MEPLDLSRVPREQLEGVVILRGGPLDNSQGKADPGAQTIEIPPFWAGRPESVFYDRTDEVEDGFPVFRFRGDDDGRELIVLKGGPKELEGRVMQTEATARFVEVPEPCFYLPERPFRALAYDRTDDMEGGHVIFRYREPAEPPKTESWRDRPPLL